MKRILHNLQLLATKLPEVTTPRGKDQLAKAVKEVTMMDKEIQKLEGHGGWVYAVAFSQDGSLLASASDDQTIRLWNPSTGQEIQKLEGHTNGIYAVAFSQDGSLLASASWDETVRLWNPATGQEIQKLGNVGYNTTLIFTNDNQNLLFNHGSILIGKESLFIPTSGLVSNQILVMEGNWIRQDNYNFLWLPHEYRHSRSTFHNNTFAFSLHSGQVSFLRLDFSS